MKQFFTMTFPLIGSGRFASPTLVFIVGFAELGVPLASISPRRVRPNLEWFERNKGQTRSMHTCQPGLVPLVPFCLIGKIAADRQKRFQILLVLIKFCFRSWRRDWCVLQMANFSFSPVLP
jgi:hypothetical protein